MLSDITKQKLAKLPVILSIQETAAFFSIHYRTVRRMIRRRELPAWKDEDGIWCILRDDLRKYCSRNSNL
ncbi:MAG: helix-turn-helix domain-containing protein [Treponema sp.]|nr:helix-turn-helix domain-containing protein [Treponema sp.]